MMGITNTPDPLPAVGTWEKGGRSQGQRWDDEGQRADQGQNGKGGWMAPSRAVAVKPSLCEEERGVSHLAEHPGSHT